MESTMEEIINNILAYEKKNKLSIEKTKLEYENKLINLDKKLQKKHDKEIIKLKTNELKEAEILKIKTNEIKTKEIKKEIKRLKQIETDINKTTNNTIKKIIKTII